MSKTDQLRALREAKFASQSAKPKADQLIHTGITIHKGVTLTPATAIEVLQAAADNVANWTIDRTSAAKQLGSLGGKSKSPAKQAASKANGKKGGRPPSKPSA